MKYTDINYLDTILIIINDRVAKCDVYENGYDYDVARDYDRKYEGDAKFCSRLSVRLFVKSGNEETIRDYVRGPNWQQKAGSHDVFIAGANVFSTF